MAYLYTLPNYTLDTPTTIPAKRTAMSRSEYFAMLLFVGVFAGAIALASNMHPGGNPLPSFGFSIEQAEGE